MEVLISSFQARALDGQVELVWEVVGDEEINGFRLYRGGEADVDVLINADQLIPLDARMYIDSDIRGGRIYRYTLGVVREDQLEIRSQSLEVKTKVLSLALHQNVPNPFNPVTKISFTLPGKTRVNLSVFNVEGRLIKTLINGVLDEGLVEIEWDGTNASGNQMSSGIYFYKLKVGKKELTKKMVLLK